ncbi:Granzyme K [Manis javanica]|nr:Granzyme K [Manis javanica]
MTTFPSFSLFFLIAGAYLTSECFNMEIIGGKEVSPHSRPFMASIQYSGEHMCGGVLIHPQWVLTAAHCHPGSAKGQSSKVVLGAHSLSKNEASKQMFEVKKFIQFSRLKSDLESDDIMLVKLNKKAAINKNVAILRLPENGDDVKPGTQCRVAGWGKFHNKSPVSDVLREVNITVIDRKICNDQKHYNYNPMIGVNMICAGSFKGGRDSCNGDSGSPLICEGTFRGITAFGLSGKCGHPQGPGIYTLLSKKHLNWIKTTLKKGV